MCKMGTKFLNNYHYEIYKDYDICFKTFNYTQALLARHEVNNEGYDEALLKNNHHLLACGATANIIIKRKNVFITPDLESGCMPGVMRNKGIQLGIFKESKIQVIPKKGDQWLLINSLGCQSIYKVGESILNTFNRPERLWREILYK